jgi:hypothetical protein
VLDKIYKLLMIVGVALAIGMWAQRASSGTALEGRLAAVERQTAENTMMSRETASLLLDTAALLRAHEVNDASVTETVRRNTEIINRLTGGSR